MRAAQIHQKGPAEEVIKIEEVDRPSPGKGEVRLDVEACALNHFDVLARTSDSDWSPDYPLITGGDIVGRVERLGPGVEMEMDQRVVVYPEIGCGTCEWCEKGEQSMCPKKIGIGEERQGGLAESVVVPASNCMSVPEDLSEERAAAWPIAYTTAWRMVISKGELRPHEIALILGASGGVGNAALQVADYIGAKTFATTSSKKKAKLIEPWTDHVFNYTQENFAEAVRDITNGRGVDFVVDHIGQETWQRSIDSLAPGGRMAVCGATSGSNVELNIRSVYQRHRSIVGAPIGSKSDFRAVGSLVFEGSLNPIIHKVLSLDEVEIGHRLLEERKVVGKVVIKP